MKANVIFSYSRQDEILANVWQSPHIPIKKEHHALSIHLVSLEVDGVPISLRSNNFTEMYVGSAFFSEDTKPCFNLLLRGSYFFRGVNHSQSLNIPTFDIGIVPLLKFREGIAAALKAKYGVVEVPAHVRFKNELEYIII